MIATDVRLTPVIGGATLVIDGRGEFSVTPEGNVLFEFDELVRDYQTLLTGIAARRVEQYANRAGTFEAVTDPGCLLVTVAYTEVSPYEALNGEPVVYERTLNAVVSLTQYRRGPRSDAMSLLAYRADYRYERGTGIEEVAPVSAEEGSEL